MAMPDGDDAPVSPPTSNEDASDCKDHTVGTRGLRMTVDKRDLNCSGVVRADEHTVCAGLELGSLVFRPVPLGAIVLEFGRPSGLDKGVERGRGAWNPPALQTLLRGLNTEFGINSQSVAVLHSRRLFDWCFARVPTDRWLEVVISAGSVNAAEGERPRRCDPARSGFWPEASARRRTMDVRSKRPFLSLLVSRLFPFLCCAAKRREHLAAFWKESFMG